MVASPRLIRTTAGAISAVRRQANRNRAVVPTAAPSTALPYTNHADGSAQRPYVVTDEAGTPRVGLVDLTMPASRSNQALFLADATGRRVVTTDPAGGLATPGLPVPLYPQFVSTNTGFTAGATGGMSATVTPSGSSAKTLMWAGIASVTHPRFYLAGLFGGNANTLVWSVEINGTEIGRWSTTGQVYGPNTAWDCTAELGQQLAAVNLFLLSWTANTLAYCQVLGAVFKGS